MNDTAYLFSGLEMSLGLALHQESPLAPVNPLALHRESPLAPVNPLAPARPLALHRESVSALSASSAGMASAEMASATEASGSAELNQRSAPASVDPVSEAAALNQTGVASELVPEMKAAAPPPVDPVSESEVSDSSLAFQDPAEVEEVEEVESAPVSGSAYTALQYQAIQDSLSQPAPEAASELSVSEAQQRQLDLADPQTPLPLLAHNPPDNPVSGQREPH